jgi:hypothetical protein
MTEDIDQQRSRGRPFSYVEGGVTHELSRFALQPLAINATNDLTRREGAIVLKKRTDKCTSIQYYTQYTPAEYISIYDVNREARADISYFSRRRGFSACGDHDSATAFPSSFDDFTSDLQCFETVDFDMGETEYPTSDWGEITGDETEANIAERAFWNTDPDIIDPIALDFEMFGSRSEPHPYYADYGEAEFKTVYRKATRMQETEKLDDSIYDPDEKVFVDMDITLGQYLMVLTELRVTLQMGDTQVHTIGNDTPSTN